MYYIYFNSKTSLRDNSPNFKQILNDSINFYKINTSVEPSKIGVNSWFWISIGFLLILQMTKRGTREKKEREPREKKDNIHFYSKKLWRWIYNNSWDIYEILPWLDHQGKKGYLSTMRYLEVVLWKVVIPIVLLVHEDLIFMLNTIESMTLQQSPLDIWKGFSFKAWNG